MLAHVERRSGLASSSMAFLRLMRRHEEARGIVEDLDPYWSD
ncbi:MAG: hypothetical protein K0Q60_4749 [Microvirga sp.]|jgi:hypothetical protein|nr:hypothetical protein [Microvirga sp.]